MLRDLHKTSLMEKSKDLSKLSPDVINDIQKNIRDGAEDLKQKWANALELTHKAYEVAGVQRPTPDMHDAWKQYEENISYAVEQLSKARGMDADWRMSSAMFHEALQESQKKLKKFRVTINTGKSKETYTTQAEDFEDVIETIKDKDTKMHDVKVIQPDPRTVMLKFSKFNIRRNVTVRIEQMKQM